MERALIFLSTLGCTALGWFLGNNHRSSPSTDIEEGARTTAPASTMSAARGSTGRSADVHDIFTRINMQFSLQHQDQERAARLFDELQSLKDDEFVSAIANLSSEKGWLGGEAARLLVGYWAERDLPAARRWVLGLDEKAASNLCSGVFETWSRADLPGMFEWLENSVRELPSKTHRESAGFELAKAAWRLDPERGMRLVRLLEPDGGHLWNLYHQWAEHDPVAASARVLRETDTKIRDNVIFAVASTWAPRDPVAAKAWAERIPDPLIAARTVTMVGSVLGWRDPPAAADYLAHIPQTNETREALKEAVGNWAERDPDAAFEWAANLDNAPLGDWVASAVTAKLPKARRPKAEERWRELRRRTPGKGALSP